MEFQLLIRALGIEMGRVELGGLQMKWLPIGMNIDETSGSNDFHSCPSFIHEPVKSSQLR